MDRCTEADIEQWLKPTLKSEELEDYTVVISGTSEKGDGYIGDITFVEVSGKSKTGEKKNYHFVVKCGKKSKKLRDAMPIRTAFENEIFFYDEILPTFKRFQKEKGVREPFCHTPKCFATLIFEEMEVLILENLKKRGYVLHDRYQPMNMEHIKTIVKLYGKLHAISFALKDQNPEMFHKLAKRLVDVFKIESDFKPPDDFNPYQLIIDLAKEENDTSIVEKAYTLKDKSKKWADLTDAEDPYAVILHGDCWNNNFMFKYPNDQRTVPSEVCLLDFQISKLASPVYDLSYFLFTCLAEEDVQKFDEINNLYYDSFSASLKEMGGDPCKMFPFEELLNQWKKFSLHGLTLMPGIIKICVSEKDEVQDLAKTAEKDEGFENVFNTDVRNKEMYRRRTFPIMRLAITKGFAE